MTHPRRTPRVALLALVGLFVAVTASATPSLDWSSLLGGDGEDRGLAVGLDRDGFVYVGGHADGPSAPDPGGRPPLGPGAFVSKIDPIGPRVLWSFTIGTRLPGDASVVRALAVDELGRVVFVGSCDEGTPLVEPFDPTHRIDEGCIGRIAADGRSLEFLSNYGRGEAVVIASDGSILVAGTTSDPGLVTVRPFQEELKGSSDAFVGRLEPGGRRLRFSTYLGGAGDDTLGALALGKDGDLYVGGRSTGGSFPLVAPFHADAAVDDNAVLARLSPTGELRWSTFYPGASAVIDLLVDPADELHAALAIDSMVFETKRWFLPLAPADTTGLVKLTSDGQHVRHAGTLHVVLRDLALDDRGSVLASVNTPGPIRPVDAPIHSSGSRMDGGIVRLAPGHNAVDWAFGIAAGPSGGLSDEWSETVFSQLAHHEGEIIVVGETNGIEFPLIDPMDGEADGREATLMKLGALSDNDVEEPSALDAGTWRPPLVIGKPPLTRSLDLGWEETQGDRYRLVLGDLDVLAGSGTYTHDDLPPCELTEPEVSIPLPDGNVYFLIVGVDDSGEVSSYGRDSFGRERPTADGPCG
ncbi:MAG: hypothetical protein AAF533_28180 [Acidobacteriota bacterium]